MEENKFEKQVQQKMDELKLNPSDSVWEHVKSRIEKRKSRRWGFLIFFFLFALLFSGGYWLFNSTDQSISNDHEISNNSKKQEGDTSFINKNNVIEEKVKANQLTLLEKEGSSPGNEKKNNANEEIIKTHSQNIVTGKSNKEKKYGNMIVAINSPEAETVNLPGKINDEVKSNPVLDEPGDSNVNIEVTPGIQNGLILIDSIKKDISIDKNVTKKLAVQEDTLADNNRKKSSKTASKNKWNMGFFISGGISHVGNQFLGLGSPSADYLQNSNGTGAGGIQIPSPSKVKNSTGYIAGIFLEKDISSKTKISFEINYKEFNTSNLVGRKNDTTGTYSARNTQARYYNNFKFIELPLQLNVQLGKSKTFPLFWSGGITLSQLIKSNALQFDPYIGSYYKDNSLFNKTQFGINTGLSTVLLQNKKSTILLGPYFSYTASQLANDGLYNKKHFVFIGLHTEIIFRKK